MATVNSITLSLTALSERSIVLTVNQPSDAELKNRSAAANNRKSQQEAPQPITASDASSAASNGLAAAGASLSTASATTTGTAIATAGSSATAVVPSSSVDANGAATAAMFEKSRITGLQLRSTSSSLAQRWLRTIASEISHRVRRLQEQQSDQSPYAQLLSNLFVFNPIESYHPLRLPRFVSVEGRTEKCHWFNLFIDRYFKDLETSEVLKTMFTRILTRKFDRIKRPDYIVRSQCSLFVVRISSDCACRSL